MLVIPPFSPKYNRDNADEDNFRSGSFYTDNVVAPSPTGSIPDFSNITGNHFNTDEDPDPDDDAIGRLLKYNW